MGSYKKAMREKAATQKDVARLAGVSVTTVSRVLNGSSLVDNETRTKVKQSMKKLNYKPNLVAYGLRARSSRLIGLILPELSHNWYALCCQYVEACCEEKGYSVLLGLHHNEMDRERRIVDEFQRRNVDGFILQSAVDDQNITEYLNGMINVPMVLFGHSFASRETGNVQFDNYRSGFMAAEYLAELGHRKIACTAGPQNMVYLRERLTGFQDGLRKNGIEIPHENMLECNFNYQVSGDVSGMQAAERFCLSRRREDWPTAIWAHNDLIAIGIIKALSQKNYRVPEDISVMGHDNIALTDMIYPPLTTIGQPIQEMSLDAVEMLIREIEQSGSGFKSVKLEPELVIRESTTACRNSMQRD